ncbi:MAG: LysE family transporter [Candidatus Cloacimonas sp.]|nr:LysE family transporter [Candidatus Cloacimonadota bacterium]
MNYALLLKGLTIGFILASPFGPIGIVFIQRSLESDKLEGVAAGFGIASGDMFYTIITTLGIAYLYNLILNYIVILKIVVLVALVVLAIRTLRAKIKMGEEKRERSILKSFGLTFLLALHNPSTILLLAFLFGLFKMGNQMGLFNSILVIISIFTGSVILWTILNHFIHKVKAANKLEHLQKLYRISDILLLIISLALFYDLISPHLGWSV